MHLNRFTLEWYKELFEDTRLLIIVSKYNYHCFIIMLQFQQLLEQLVQLPFGMLKKER